MLGGVQQLGGEQHEAVVPGGGHEPQEEDGEGQVRPEVRVRLALAACFLLTPTGPDEEVRQLAPEGGDWGGGRVAFIQRLSQKAQTDV